MRQHNDDSHNHRGQQQQQQQGQQHPPAAYREPFWTETAPAPCQLRTDSTGRKVELFACPNPSRCQLQAPHLHARYQAPRRELTVAPSGPRFQVMGFGSAGMVIDTQGDDSHEAPILRFSGAYASAQVEAARLNLQETDDERQARHRQEIALAETTISAGRLLAQAMAEATLASKEAQNRR